jgi:hypothetical protein
MIQKQHKQNKTAKGELQTKLRGDGGGGARWWGDGNQSIPGIVNHASISNSNPPSISSPNNTEKAVKTQAIQRRTNKHKKKHQLLTMLWLRVEQDLRLLNAVLRNGNDVTIPAALAPAPQRPRPAQAHDGKF